MRPYPIWPLRERDVMPTRHGTAVFSQCIQRIDELFFDANVMVSVQVECWVDRYICGELINGERTDAFELNCYDCRQN